MPLYILDTNALSRVLRGRDPGLKARVTAHLVDCRLSAISLMELYYGAEKRPDIPVIGERLKVLRQLFPDVAAFDEHAARRAGQVRAFLASLKPNAQPVGHYDLLLAGHALSIGAILVTHNVHEFVRVPGLVVEDWQTED
ncbi:putative nucleic acid-binding protein [Opitutaceae bacterium TAV1]|nr:putative nucleic acid-binding protein [Opitutaceae bacterium TAV1]EIP96747.1 putative nucleic acid-binding protein [Opitutaceae bacterium TAV1]